jgi:hypothetical protein
MEKTKNWDSKVKYKLEKHILKLKRILKDYYNIAEVQEFINMIRGFNNKYCIKGRCKMCNEPWKYIDLLIQMIYNDWNDDWPFNIIDNIYLINKIIKF